MMAMMADAFRGRCLVVVVNVHIVGVARLRVVTAAELRRCQDGQDGMRWAGWLAGVASEMMELMLLRLILLLLLMMKVEMRLGLKGRRSSTSVLAIISRLCRGGGWGGSRATA